MFGRRTFAAATAIAGLFYALAASPTFAQTGDWDAVVAAAKKEGSLVFYTSENPAVNAKLIAAFKARYGVNVEVLRLATGELTQRFSSEASSGAAVADAIVLSDARLFTRNPSWFLSLNASTLPSAAAYPAAARNERFIDMYVHPNGITFNTSELVGPNAPKSWEDLIEPRFKGKILFTDPRTAPTYINQLGFLRETYGEDYLRKLAAQGLTIADSAAPAAQQIAAGAYAVSTFSTPPHAEALIARKAPVAHVTPEKTSGVAQSVALSAKAKHPNAARLWADFLLSKEGAEISCAGITASLRGDAQGCRALPAGYKPPRLDWSEAEVADLLKLVGMAR